MNWIEKYWEFMVAENFEEAIPLKILNFPKSFFKYRELNEKTLDAFNENYIWLAEISTLNDPFECSIQIDNNECLREYYSSEKFRRRFALLTSQVLTDKEINSLKTSNKPFEEYITICKKRNIPFSLSPEQQIKKIQERWKEIVDETNLNLRICSFSLIYSSLLLWSHYSNEHKGICVEYDFEDIDIIRAFIQPIIYRDKVHKIGLLEEYTSMQMIASSLIKSSEWKYENEWRLTIFKQKENFKQKMPVPLPKAIYLGTRFHLNNEKNKKRFFEIVEKNKIPLFQMEKDPNEFKLMKTQYTTR